MSTRGNIKSSVSNISVVTEGTRDGNNVTVKKTQDAEYIIFENNIFDKYELDKYIRNNGSRKFLQCLDVLFNSSTPLLFVEIGGCTGGMINTFLTYDSNSKIFCVEPNSHLADELKGKFGEYVDVENIGLGSKSEKGTLHITKRPQFSSRLSPDQDYAEVELLGRTNKYKGGSLSVKATQEFDVWKGDDYFAKKGIDSCDVISLNTQGTELDILMGFKESLRKGLIKALKIEIDMQYRYKEMNDSNFSQIDYLMTSNGYRIFEILQISNLAPVGIRLMDILYVHKSIDLPR